jgi:hypothetical protein
MTSPDLDRLVEAGLLQREPPNREEFDGLVDSAANRLADAERAGLSLDGRFDLAYNAGHALALAALRRRGYRAGKRYVVFQVLESTLGVPKTKWQVLARCHGERNRIEYEGLPNLTEKLVAELAAIVREMLDAVRALPPIDEEG